MQAPTTPSTPSAPAPSSAIVTQPVNAVVPNSKLPVWPAEKWASAVFTVLTGSGVAYQWQKREGKGAWANLRGEVAPTLSIKCGLLGGIPSCIINGAFRHTSDMLFRCVCAYATGSATGDTVTSNEVRILPK